MIIKFPTGFYSRSQFTQNITFTVSSAMPFFGSSNIAKVPEGIIAQNPRAQQGTIISSRPQFGQQIATVTKANAAATGSTTKKYAYGQAIELTPPVPVASVEQMYVSTGVEYLHDQNVLDLQSFGLTFVESNSLTFSGLEAFEQLRVELSQAIAARKDAELAIGLAKTNLGDCEKTLAAAKVIGSTLIGPTQYDEIIKTLEAKKQQLLAEITAQTIIANETALNASKLRNDLLTVATLVN